MTTHDLEALWLKFVNEVEAGYELTLDDYVNDLALRDIWSRVVKSSPASVRGRLSDWLAVLDARMAAATVEVPKRRRRAWQTVPDRIPKTAREELLADLEALGLDDLLGE
jgi:hypothetical protein